MREIYKGQIRLLLKVLPLMSKFEMFALKGGTALNFFVRDFPRLSVDIDLTYLPIKNRNASLVEIRQSLQQIATEIQKRIPQSNITPLESGGELSKLIIKNDNVQIKLEVNTVLRGAIYGTKELELAPSLQDEFEMFVSVKTLSFEDLYGGKLCAALDRQHPRDLYDIRLLLRNEGITDRLKNAFIGYLISHSRPINELLSPNIISIVDLYMKEFEGMTEEADIYDELIVVQQTLPGLILSKLTRDDKEFLLSFKKGIPKWELIPIPILKKMPGVQWKLLNLSKMETHKHKQAIEKLEKVLFQI
jgi:predicted nucleotidyltransferase component of viral defense system